MAHPRLYMAYAMVASLCDAWSAPHSMRHIPMLPSAVGYDADVMSASVLPRILAVHGSRNVGVALPSIALSAHAEQPIIEIVEATSHP